MVFLHFMACFWVALGRQDGGWVTVHRPGASDVEQQHVSMVGCGAGADTLT